MKPIEFFKSPVRFKTSKSQEAQSRQGAKRTPEQMRSRSIRQGPTSVSARLVLGRPSSWSNGSLISAPGISIQQLIISTCVKAATELQERLEKVGEKSQG